MGVGSAWWRTREREQRGTAENARARAELSVFLPHTAAECCGCAPLGLSVDLNFIDPRWVLMINEIRHYLVPGRRLSSPESKLVLDEDS